MLTLSAECAGTEQTLKLGSAVHQSRQKQQKPQAEKNKTALEVELLAQFTELADIERAIISLQESAIGEHQRPKPLFLGVDESGRKLFLRS